jgi:hypothetical protein
MSFREFTVRGRKVRVDELPDGGMDALIEAETDYRHDLLDVAATICKQSGGRHVSKSHIQSAAQAFRPPQSFLTFVGDTCLGAAVAGAIETIIALVSDGWTSHELAVVVRILIVGALVAAGLILRRLGK